MTLYGCQPYAPATFTQGSIPGTNSVRGWVDPRDMVRREGLCQLNNPVAPSGIEPATFPFVAVSQALCQHVPPKMQTANSLKHCDPNHILS
jgi:hypothetical protein